MKRNCFFKLFQFSQMVHRISFGKKRSLKKKEKEEKERRGKEREKKEKGRKEKKKKKKIVFDLSVGS